MQGGFSMREYTLKMRSVNVMNCWPFDETFSEESVKSLLPPIIVKRFTWWIDETAEKLGQSERETKRVFERGETSSRIVDRDLECDEEGVEVVKNKSLKGKIRATKKRSIVELFAVAPPIKRAEENTRRKKKRNKKMKNTDVILRKALRVVKRIKRKKAAEKGGGVDGIGATDKENCSKLKQHAQEEATGNSGSLCSRESDNDIHYCVSNSKRKPRLQDLGLYKNFVPCKNQHSEIPKRGILKNQSKEMSLKQSKECLLQKTVKRNVADKRTTFLENDQLLRSSRRPSDIGIVDCAIAVEKDLTRSESSGNEQMIMFNVDSTTLEKQNYEREYGSSERSAMYYTVDQDWSDHASGFLHMPRDAYYNGHNVKVITTASNTSCSTFPPLCSEDYLKTHNDASMSQLSHMKRTENTALNCSPSLHFQTFPPLYPNELLQTRDIRVRSTNVINDEFVGLPLNSQGELMTLNSNVSASHCIGLYLPSNAVSKTLDDGTSGNQLNLFPMESFAKENSRHAIPSRLGIIESQSFDFPEINLHQQKGHANEKCHSTMRLMGKEFEVGCRGVQGIEDGRMWKDKQIMDEFRFRNEPSHGDMRETLFFPSEITINHRSESKFAQTQTSSTYKSVFLTRTGVCCPSHYPDTYSEVHNSKSLSDPFTTGYNSQFFTRDQRLCSNMSNKQNLHYSPISAIKFPFMHPDLDSHGKSSWARRHCFDISEKGPLLSNSQSYTSVCNHQYPSVSALQSMAPAPLTPSSYYPNKIKERMKSRIGIRELNICKKSKGQVSPLSNALGFHEGLQYAIRNMEDASRDSRFFMTGEYDRTNKYGQKQTILPFMNHILKAKDQDIPLSATNIDFRFS